MSEVMPAPPKRRMSYSQLSQLKQCGYSFYLQRIAKDQNGNRLQMATAAWFMQGTAEHHAIEMWERSGRTIDAVAEFTAEYDRSIAAAMQTHPDEYLWLRGGRKGRDQDIAERRAIGIQQVARYVEWAPTQPWRIWTDPAGVPALELSFSIRLGDVEVIGFIDAIWEHEDGSLEPVDWKTGSQKPKAPDQLDLYGTVIREIFGEEVSQGRFFMLKTWDHEPFPLEDKGDELTQEYADAAAQIEAQDFQPNPGSCFTCVAKFHCPFSR